MIIDRKIEGALPDARLSAAAVSQLTATIGTPTYVNAALHFAQKEIRVSFISVFCQGDRDTPLLVGTACTLGQRRADQAAKGYDRHCAVDRNSAVLAGASGLGDFLTLQHADSISSFTYRRDCYEQPGIAARLSLIRRTPSFGLAVSLYSSAEDGVFPAKVLDRATAILGVLLATTERYVAYSLKGNTWQGQDIQTRLAVSYPDLTKREREVAAMTIKGRTAVEIAEILGLAETTIITHRKKAYRRMNVASLRELMATI